MTTVRLKPDTTSVNDDGPAKAGHYSKSDAPRLRRDGGSANAGPDFGVIKSYLSRCGEIVT